jgi:RNA polymerase sigma-70 factor (ECF subfamily)
LSESETNVFLFFLDRLRRGDDEAIRAFVAKYEPYIRRSLRYKIARAQLQSAADSVDILQSVFSGFLLRLSAGDYELSSEDDLRRLLVSIANKKFMVLSRRETAAKRDYRQTESLDRIEEVAGPDPDESHIKIDHADMLLGVTRRLKPDELVLFTARCQGQSWNTISERSGECADILRKRLSRALHRVAVELKLEDDDS